MTTIPGFAIGMASSAIIAVTASPALADVTMPSVFSDHMVLQRELPVPVWGTATPGEAVTVRFGERLASTVADAEGRWRVTLDPLVASADARTMVIEGRNRVEIEDVLVGEVWICGGQSNMEWPVDASSDPAREKATANRPALRLIKAPHVTSNRPADDIAASWTVCTPETVGGFTAVGYAFGRHLQDELGVPVGLLSLNWGGTRIEPWISNESLMAADLSRDAMAAQLDAIVAHESMSEGERFDAAEKARIQHSRSTANYLDRQLSADSGLQEKVIATGYDDSAWSTVDLPKSWSETDPSLRDFDGGAWYRRTIEVPENWSGRNLLLELGGIDDSDAVWFDGVRVGSSIEAWPQPRRYRVPGAIVKSGSRTISVLCIDAGGEGGFGGPADAMRIGVVDRMAADPAFIRLSGAWKWRKGGSHQGRRPAPAPSTLPSPGTRATDYSALHNAMIQPFAPYGVRGAIWYQGESNAGEPDRYHRFMPMLVDDWGMVFERDDLPFGIVQLAAFKAFKPDQPVENDWPLLREAQSSTAVDMPHVGIVVTTDIGDARDIHPRNKREVGRRLAAWALHDHYDRPNDSYASPRITGCSKVGPPDGVDTKVPIRAVRLEVDHVMDGLKTRDGQAPSGFAVQGPSGRWHWARAMITEGGDAVVVWTETVPDPVAVAYAWQNNPERANLVGGTGLPVDQYRGRCE